MPSFLFSFTYLSFNFSSSCLSIEVIENKLDVIYFQKKMIIKMKHNFKTGNNLFIFVQMGARFSKRTLQ